MKSHKLGNTDISVSQAALGTMYFGTKVDQEMSFKIIDMYREAGGNFLDTANIYASWVKNGKGGESERIIGNYLRKTGDRDDLVIATKAGARFVKEGDWRDSLEKLDYPTLSEQIQLSKERMSTDHIDLYFAHIDDRTTHMKKTLIAFQKLIDENQISTIGCSNFHPWRIERAKCLAEDHGWTQYSVIQQGYTYLPPQYDAEFVEGRAIQTSKELLDYVKSNSISFMGYSPLLSGAYTREDREIPDNFRTADFEKRLRVLQRASEELDATPNQVVLAWMMQRDPPCIPLITASSEEQMEENLDAFTISLSDDQINQLNSPIKIIN